MKQIISIALVLMLSLQMVLAQELVTANDVPTLPEQAVLPGDGLYGLDKAMESIQYALTFTPEGKAKFRLLQAQERLAELQQLSDEKQERYTVQLMNEHKLALGESAKLGEEIRDLAHQKEHEALVAAATAHHVQVLAEVKAKIQARHEERERMMHDGDITDDDELSDEQEISNAAITAIGNAEENSNNARISAETRIREINGKGFNIPVKIGGVDY